MIPMTPVFSECFARPRQVGKKLRRRQGVEIDSWKVNKAALSLHRPPATRTRQTGMRNDPHPIPGGESLLFLTDDQIRRGIEAMYFAYRAFTADPDLILEEIGYGRAHHRALHFITRDPGLTVTALLEVLGVTKQSLNRVLRTLIEDGLVDSRVGRRDRRERQRLLVHHIALMVGLRDIEDVARALAAGKKTCAEGHDQGARNPEHGRRSA